MYVDWNQCARDNYFDLYILYAAVITMDWIRIDIH